MKIACIGGGPAGLYLGILMKNADPGHQVRIYERNRPDDTFGFGVVFSDATLGNLAAADPVTYAEITKHFAHWDDIDTHVGGRVFRSRGHGFCGLSRKTLLGILQKRCGDLGVEMFFETAIDDPESLDADVIVAADGVASGVRERFAEHFVPDIDVRPNKFVWLGTTYPFEAFTFYFKQSEHGLFRVHAYRYQETGSTFIVECTEDTWRRAGLDQASEDDTIGYLQNVFAAELAGHPLIKNKSIWRNFPTIRNKTWHHKNIVLVGDAAHTAHFSIGSGTKLAMEDCIDLANALSEAGPDGLEAALVRYEEARRPDVEALQRAAQVSLEWFENTERTMGLPPEQFAFSLLTRSLRVTHENLKKRDPALVAEVDGFFARQAQIRCGLPETPPGTDVPPPMFTPLRIGDVVLKNRLVARAAPLDLAKNGAIQDIHLAHMGSLALGGAGLLLTEPTAVASSAFQRPGSAGMFSLECERAWARAVALIHEHSAAAVGLVLGASGHPNAVDLMDRDAMDAYRTGYATAAERARFARFDLLCLDLTTESLLGRVVSPLENHRDGDLDARLRFPLEVVAAVRAAWPSEKPLAARITAQEPGGLNAGDAVHMARALSAAGCELIEVTVSPDAVPRGGRLPLIPLADQVRNEAGVLTLAVDEMASFADMNSILAAGRADLLAPARTLLFDPFYPLHAAQAQGHDLAWPAPLAAARDFVLRD